MDQSKIEWTGLIWKAIPEHHGYYASSDGQILSLKGHTPRILKPIKSRDGHLYVFLYDKGVMKKVWVHRAVLSAICGEDKKGLMCRHLDDNPSNNIITNLAWGTAKQNSDDKRKNGNIVCGEKTKHRKLSSSQVMEIRSRYSAGEKSRKLASEYGISPKHICAIVRGATWSHLPVIEVKVSHSSARITPPSREHIAKLLSGNKAYWSKKRKERIMVECACGCGGLLQTPDSKGRNRRYLHGHNTRINHKKEPM